MPSARMHSTASAASCSVTSISARSRLREAVEHVTGAVLLARRFANTDPDPKELVGLEVRGDRAQAVVSGEAATCLEFHRRGRKIELVLHDHDRAGLASISRRRTSGATATPESFM